MYTITKIFIEGMPGGSEKIFQFLEWEIINQQVGKARITQMVTF